MGDEELFIAPVRDDEALNLSLDGWEGPLDLLLNLARQQKVDLHQISILALVEQYLTYLDQAKALRLEIAADYLVMAAWLAYLKSCLLLPKDPTVDPSPEELAMRLQLRLQRLDAMRDAGARLMGRDRLGRDVFARGEPEGLKLVERLIAKCDAVVENFSAEVLPNWGLTWERIHELNPQIVYMSSSGFGHTGDWKGYRSFGPTAAAQSGHEGSMVT